MRHLGLDFSQPSARSPAFSSVFEALHTEPFRVTERDLDAVFTEVRRGRPDAVSIVVALGSFVPVAITDAIERAARRAGFRAAQTLAAPTAGAIAYATTHPGAGLIGVATANPRCIDIGVFRLDGVRVLPLAVSGLLCRQLDLDSIELAWAPCAAALHARGESLTRWVGFGQRAPLDHVGRLIGHAASSASVDAIVAGARRCAELLELDEVIPIRDG